MIQGPVSGVSLDDLHFLSSRAKSVLYLESNPSRERLWRSREQGCIGEFIDRYEVALELFMTVQKTEINRIAEADSALDHVLKISHGQMSHVEALRFWDQIFSCALPAMSLKSFRQIRGEGKEYIYPTIPAASCFLERAEWNPLEGQPQEEKSGNWIPTILDCMVLGSIWRPQWPYVRPMYEPAVLSSITRSIPFKASPIWSLKRVRALGKRNFVVQEA